MTDDDYPLDTSCQADIWAAPQPGLGVADDKKWFGFHRKLPCAYRGGACGGIAGESRDGALSAMLDAIIRARSGHDTPSGRHISSQLKSEGGLK